MNSRVTHGVNGNGRKTRITISRFNQQFATSSWADRIDPWRAAGRWVQLLLGFAMIGILNARDVVESFSVPFDKTEVRFDYRVPVRSSGRTQVLLLVPSYNGPGERMLTEEWKQFADKNGLILLAPSFRATPEELAEKRGYYYPAQGSGEAVERALVILATRANARTDQIFIFGFSAGAHFAHRFALWRPAQVGAFVAAAAAWWDAPTRALSRVPALIVCGEEDPRLAPSLEFFQEGAELGLPWVWRSYRETGHRVPPTMLALAQAFLAHYVRAERDEVSFGDGQTYAVTTDAEEIPETVRVRLPSPEVAKAWRREQ